MKKLSIITALCLTLLSQSAFAKKTDLNAIIKNSNLDKTGTVAVSVRNAQTGAVEFAYNQDKLLHPASVLKLVTIPAALDTLSSGYKFETKLALDQKNLYIKLGADPSLTTAQLQEAINNIKEKQLTNIYIDDKIIDRFEWGIGWMWDDETNPLMAKISPYNLNHNLLTVKIEPTTLNYQAKLTPTTKGAATVINMVTTGSKNEIMIYRQNSMSPNVVYLYGTIATPQSVTIPIGNPERYFLSNLTNLLKSRNIVYSELKSGPYNTNCQTVFTIENPIEPMLAKALKYSDNLYAETLFKIAGGVKANGQGTFQNSLEMFNSYYKQLGLDTSEVILADGSGVSRNNLFSTDWISNALYKIQKDQNFELIKANLASPTQGTLKNRLKTLENNFQAKTGTLANNSTIAGYLTDKNGAKHIVVIFVANYKEDDSVARALQDKIITELFNN